MKQRAGAFGVRLRTYAKPKDRIEAYYCDRRPIIKLKSADRLTSTLMMLNSSIS